MTKYNLREHAILVRFTASKWGISRKDAERTEAAARQYDSNTNMVALTKNLIDPKNPLYKAIAKNIGLAGNTFRAMAGPWDKSSGGFWIISTKGYPKLQSVMLEFEQINDELVEDFIKALPMILAEAQQAAGQLYDPALIPTPSEIRDAFTFEFETEVLPDRGNTILDLDEKRAAMIRDDAEAKANKQLADLSAYTHEVLRDKLTDVVTNMREFGDEIDGSKRTRSFKNSLVQNMRDLCDLLPALNVQGNPKMDKLAQDIAAKLAINSADDLRGNKVKGDKRSDEAREAEAATLRENTADAAQDMLDNLAGVFGNKQD